MSVAPLDERTDLAADGSAIQRLQDASKRLVLDGANETLDGSQAAVLGHGPKPLADAASTSPAAEALVGRLRGVIGDEVGRRGTDFSYYPAQDLSYGETCRVLGEDGLAHDPPREVIGHDGDPPTAWPARRQRPGQPRNPETPGRRDGCRIDMPGMVGTIRAKMSPNVGDGLGR